jgi:hypothetical protein
MIRGDWLRLGPEIDAGVPRIANLPGASEPLADAPHPRSALARWLTQPDHPLTSRVIANRLWQHHFGNGLVRSVSDFGIVGEEPSHPELLDWLAMELMQHDWHLKHLHRLMLTSSTYRQASRPSQVGWSEQQRIEAAESWQESQALDASNYFLARFPRRRLTGEEVRDAMLVTSDSMQWRRGGPGVRPPLPDELVKTLLKNQWNVSPQASDHYRRSIYIFARRNLRFPIFEVFDRPDANASCPQRGRSTTAPQSLLLLNSQASIDASRRLAGVVLSASTELEPRLVFVVGRILARMPTVDEKKLLAEFLSRQRELLASEARPTDELALPDPLIAHVEPYEAAAWTDLCLALYNLSEFLYID